MRAFVLLATASFLLLPMTALAGSGDPTGGHPCDDRAHPCTDVQAGTMDCMPERGAADQLSSVVGAADSGTFRLLALGANHPGSAQACTFEIRVDPAGASFNKDWTVGVVGPGGAVTSASSQPCTANPGETCMAGATFTWWRAQHGVTFDVPFALIVNGVEVAHGSCHYYDPPAFETVYGGPLAL